MKILKYLIFLVFFPAYSFSQDYANDMNHIKGHAVNVKLIFKWPILYHIHWRYIYLINDSGKVTEQSNYRNNKLAAVTQYEYDNSNRLTTETDHDIINKRPIEVYKHSYTTDQKDHIQVEKFGKGNDLFWIKDSIGYNKQGLRLYYRQKGVRSKETDVYSTARWTMIYNDKNLLTRTGSIDNKGNTTETKYNYNEHEDIAEKNYHSSTYMINDKDNKNTAFVKDGHWKYNYKYDKRGNWIKRYRIINESEKHLELVRRITYK